MPSPRLLCMCTCAAALLLRAAGAAAGGAAAAPAMPRPFKRVLRQAYPLMNGSDVVVLQNLLRRHKGVEELKVTAVFDSQTTRGRSRWLRCAAIRGPIPSPPPPHTHARARIHTLCRNCV